jgi:hypothetical protein
MRRPTARVAVAGALGMGSCILGAWAVACGLPVAGLGAVVDGSVGADGAGGDDGGSATGESGPGCATVDAACLGGIPSGWQPVTVGDGGCPSAFTAAVLATNPRTPDGGCACGACQVVGSFTCTGMTTITAGDGCGDSPPLVAGASPETCTKPANTAQHVEAHLVAASGTVACSAANDAGAGATTDPLTVCYPSCTADFCASSPHCIAADGDVACPGGFALLAKAGTGADPGCAACACDAGPAGACGGTVTVYADDVCGDAGSSTYPVGTCNTYGGAYASLFVHLEPPDAACTVTAPSASGHASLVGTRTICCQ